MAQLQVCVKIKLFRRWWLCHRRGELENDSVRMDEEWYPLWSELASFWLANINEM